MSKDARGPTTARPVWLHRLQGRPDAPARKTRSAARWTPRFCATWIASLRRRPICKTMKEYRRAAEGAEGARAINLRRAAFEAHRLRWRRRGAQARAAGEDLRLERVDKLKAKFNLNRPPITMPVQERVAFFRMRREIDKPAQAEAGARDRGAGRVLPNCERTRPDRELMPEWTSQRTVLNPGAAGAPSAVDNK